jgi:hypothetical protein
MFKIIAATQMKPLFADDLSAFDADILIEIVLMDLPTASIQLRRILMF